MNRTELKQIIEESQGPASEMARLIDELDTCIHFQDGRCTLIDTCVNESVTDISQEEAGHGRT